MCKEGAGPASNRREQKSNSGGRAVRVGLAPRLVAGNPPSTCHAPPPLCPAPASTAATKTASSPAFPPARREGSPATVFGAVACRPEPSADARAFSAAAAAAAAGAAAASVAAPAGVNVGCSAKATLKPNGALVLSLITSPNQCCCPPSVCPLEPTSCRLCFSRNLPGAWSTRVPGSGTGPAPTDVAT